MFPEIPFRPIRNSVYSPQELLAGLDVHNYRSFAETPDFKSYAYYVKHGRAAPRDPLASMMEALHDNSITQATLALLARHRKVAGIMGGHEESRNSPTYRAVARIARALSRSGFLVASGGGPGAMEATHLGASFHFESAGALESALAHFQRPAKPPANAKKVVDAHGKINDKILRDLHAWLVPAYELSASFTRPGASLAVPTWYYGHEPTTPFARHIAKYFQNSIREDGLISLAAHGIIFAKGAAGTLQEIFQDAVRNYYREPGDPFSPMVFFDKKFWTKTLPAAELLKSLFPVPIVAGTTANSCSSPATKTKRSTSS